MGVVPAWLQIVLSVWGAITALLTVIVIPLGRWMLRSMRALIDKVEAVGDVIDTHFSDDSHVSRALGGSLPTRVPRAERLLDRLRNQLGDHDEN